MSAIVGVKYWEIIADNLSKAGWSWGYVCPLRIAAGTAARRNIFRLTILPVHRIWPNTYALALLRSKGNDWIYIQRAPGRNPTRQQGNRRQQETNESET